MTRRDPAAMAPGSGYVLATPAILVVLAVATIAAQPAAAPFVVDEATDRKSVV